MQTALGLGAVIALILANAFFVAVEFALVAIDRGRLQTLVAEGHRGARATDRELRRLSFHLSGAQLGITITSLILGFIAEPTVAEVLRLAIDSRVLAVAIALVLVTVAQMVLGELIPKGIAIARPQAVALRLISGVRIYGAVFGPIILFLNGSADATVRRLGIQPREELRAVRTMEELELLIRSSGEEGALEPEAFELLTRTLRFAHKTAADALVPRVDMKVLPRGATVADLITASLETGHSRFPVIGEDLDDIVGFVHAKDALAVSPEARGTTPVDGFVTDAVVVPEGLDLEAVLTQLRDRRQHLAIVLDEYGGVAGIVSLEDLVEEIVGDIEDEHDQPVPVAGPTTPGVHLLEGGMHLDEVHEATGLRLPEGPYETVAGFVLAELGHLPLAGERVLHDRWTIEVTAMDRRRIAEVRVTAPPSHEEPAG